MLKVKNLTPLSPKKWKKSGNFDQKKSSSAQFFLQPSVAFWFDLNQNFVLYRIKVILGP